MRTTPRAQRLGVPRLDKRAARQLSRTRLRPLASIKMRKTLLVSLRPRLSAFPQLRPLMLIRARVPTRRQLKRLGTSDGLSIETFAPFWERSMTLQICTGRPAKTVRAVRCLARRTSRSNVLSAYAWDKSASHVSQTALDRLKGDKCYKVNR
jgi:hypothetical protein